MYLSFQLNSISVMMQRTLLLGIELLHCLLWNATYLKFEFEHILIYYVDIAIVAITTIVMMVTMNVKKMNDRCHNYSQLVQLKDDRLSVRSCQRQQLQKIVAILGKLLHSVKCSELLLENTIEFILASKFFNLGNL